MAGLTVASVISEVAALVLDSPPWCHSAVVVQYPLDRLQKNQAAHENTLALRVFRLLQQCSCGIYSCGIEKLVTQLFRVHFLA